MFVWMYYVYFFNEFLYLFFLTTIFTSKIQIQISVDNQLFLNLNNPRLRIIKFYSMPKFKIGKRFCFTFNNYTEEEEKKLKEELEKNAKYAVFGHEKGEEGTKHLQGFVVWKTTRRPEGLKKINAKIH